MSQFLGSSNPGRSAWTAAQLAGRRSPVELVDLRSAVQQVVETRPAGLLPFEDCGVLTANIWSHLAQTLQYAHSAQMVAATTGAANVDFLGAWEDLSADRGGGALIVQPHLGPTYLLALLCVVRQLPVTTYFVDTGAQLHSSLESLGAELARGSGHPDVDLLPAAGHEAALGGAAALRAGRILLWQPDGPASFGGPGRFPTSADFFGVPCSISNAGVRLIALTSTHRVFFHTAGWTKSGPRHSWRLWSKLTPVSLDSRLNVADQTLHFWQLVLDDIQHNYSDWAGWLWAIRRHTTLEESIAIDPSSLR